MGKGTFVRQKRWFSLSGIEEYRDWFSRFEESLFLSHRHSVEEYASCKATTSSSQFRQQLEKEETIIRHFYEIGCGRDHRCHRCHTNTTGSAFSENNQQRKLSLYLVRISKDPDYKLSGNDHEEGGYIATKHLGEPRHRKLGM